MLGMGSLMSMKMIKSYSELIQIPTYIERFNYLKIGGRIGDETFGFNRYLNQTLYRSSEWKRFRRDIIIRDNGCDLACEGHDILGKILIHHINPISIADILNRDFKIFNPDNVISCSLNTHNAVHYGDVDLLNTGPIVRAKYDTCPWKKTL